MQTKYTILRVWKRTARRLKILAALKGESMLALVDRLLTDEFARSGIMLPREEIKGRAVWAICSNCKNSYNPRRRPRSDQERYCDECRPRAASRNSSQAYRERERQKKHPETRR